MKRLYHYLPMLLLSIIMVLFALIFEAAFYTSANLLNSEYYTEVINDYHVADALYTQVGDYFRQYANPTGIPQEVFMKGMDKDKLASSARALTKQSVEYILSPSSKKPKAEYDFTDFEKSIDKYYESYAETNNIQKDEEYYSLKKRTVSIAEEKVLSLIDVMMLETVSKTGVASKIHKVTPFIDYIMYGSIIMMVIIAVLMLVVDRHHKADLLYWGGTVLFTTGGLLLIPAIYLRATGFFDGFFITQQTVYRSATGVIYKFLDEMIFLNSVMVGLGVILLIMAQIVHVIRKRKAIAQIRREAHRRAEEEEDEEES